MSQDENDDYDIIMNALSRLIQRALISARSEWAGPSMGPDQSDDHIKEQTQKVVRLRLIRSALEDVLTNTEGMIKQVSDEELLKLARRI